MQQRPHFFRLSIGAVVDTHPDIVVATVRGFDLGDGIQDVLDRAIFAAFSRQAVTVRDFCRRQDAATFFNLDAVERNLIVRRPTQIARWYEPGVEDAGGLDGERGDEENRSDPSHRPG